MVDHSQPLRCLRINHVTEIEQFACLLEANYPWHDDRWSDIREADFRLAEQGVVGGDGDVAKHGEFAAAAQRVALDGGDDRLAHIPRGEFKRHVVGQGIVPLHRIVAVLFFLRVAGVDVVADAETAPVGAQYDDTGSLICIGLCKSITQFAT